MTTTQAIADRMADFIVGSDWVSQAELIRHLDDLPLRGDALATLDNANVVLFAGCSDQFIEAIELLRSETPPRVVLSPCSPLVLLIDGCPRPLNMPLVGSRPPKGGYKSPRFAPICFRPANRVSRKDSK